MTDYTDADLARAREWCASNVAFRIERRDSGGYTLTEEVIEDPEIAVARLIASVRAEADAAGYNRGHSEGFLTGRKCGITQGRRAGLEEAAKACDLIRRLYEDAPTMDVASWLVDCNRGVADGLTMAARDIRALADKTAPAEEASDGC